MQIGIYKMSVSASLDALLQFARCLFRMVHLVAFGISHSRWLFVAVSEGAPTGERLVGVGNMPVTTTWKKRCESDVVCSFSFIDVQLFIFTGFALLAHPAQV